MNLRIIIGASLIIFTFVSFLLPKDLAANFRVHVILHGLLLIGVIILCEGITLEIKKKSLLNEILRNRSNFFAFIAVSIIGAVFLEGFGKWFGKLWIYPNFPFSKYFLLFIPAFATYWLAIVESYLAIKAIIDYLLKGRHIVTKLYNLESRFYRLLSAIGTLLIAFFALMIYFDYRTQTSLLFSIQDFSATTLTYRISFLYILMFSVGVWFIFEFVEYTRKNLLY